MDRCFLLFIISVMFATAAQAQFTICGSVVMEDEKQAFASISLLESGMKIKANKDGNFCFTDVPSGEYSLFAINEEGFVSSIFKLLVNQDISGLKIDLSDNTLETVNLQAEANNGKVQANHSIKIEIIDLDNQMRSSSSVEQLVNRAAGIRVRNSGGLGAEADVVIGGFSGKSIKFLIDGVPVDYLGSSMGLTKIPSSVADYIEIYKGVMPTEVGIDALGGAINIVTKKPDKNIHRMTYEVGSFNTHKLTLNSFYRVSDKISYGINAFGNYSDNDFKVDNLPYANEETGRTEFIRAPLFHNGYKQYSAEAYVNLENRTWADLLRIKINSYSIRRDIQNEITSRSHPFGQVFQKEHAHVVPSIEYKKKLYDDKLEISNFFVFSSIKSQLADTLKNGVYDWKGQMHPNQSGSELGNVSSYDLPIIETRVNNFTERGLISYKFNDRNKLIFNGVNTYLRRTADDLYKRNAKTHVDYNRLIAGLGYEFKLLDNRLEGLTQTKFLSSYAKGRVFNEINQAIEKPQNNSGYSFSQSLKYNFYGGLILRGSFENTYRLPDQQEIFGDNTFIMPNLKLRPEKSLNLNLGARYRKSNYHVEVNTYYRNTEDLIRLKDISQFTSIFLNLDRVKGFGVELEGAYRPIERLELSGNLTYNEFRFQGSNQNISKNEHFKNARVSNLPFYFGNAMAAYNFEEIINKKDKVRLYWSYSYVHQYYLDFVEKQYEPSGFLGLFGNSKINTDRVIPIQQVHAGGFVWTVPIDQRRTLSVSAELDNVFNENIYNNFRMQSPGRNFSAKVTYDF